MDLTPALPFFLLGTAAIILAALSPLLRAFNTFMRVFLPEKAPINSHLITTKDVVREVNALKRGEQTSSGLLSRLHNMLFQIKEPIGNPREDDNEIDIDELRL